MKKNNENKKIKVPGAEDIHALIMSLEFNEIHDEQKIKERSRAKLKNIERPCDIEDFERINVLGNIMEWILNFCEIIIRGRLDNNDIEDVKYLIYLRLWEGTALINYRFGKNSFNAGSLIRFIKQVARFSIADFYGSISGEKVYITEDEFDNYEFENIRFDDKKGPYVYKNTPTKKDMGSNPVFVSLDLMVKKIIEDNNYDSDSYDDYDYYDHQNDNDNCSCEEISDPNNNNTPGYSIKNINSIEYYGKIFKTIFSHNTGTIDIKVSYFYNLLNKLEKFTDLEKKKAELEELQIRLEQHKKNLDEEQIRKSEEAIELKKTQVETIDNQTRYIRSDFHSTYNLNSINNYSYEELRSHMIKSLKVFLNTLNTDDKYLKDETLNSFLIDFDKVVSKKYHGSPSEYRYTFDENDTTFPSAYSRFNRNIQAKIQSQYHVYIRGKNKKV